MKNVYYVKPQGTSGGLALSWNKEVDIRILAANHNLIDCEIWPKHQSMPIWVTWIYADVHRRHILWNSLRNLGWGRSSMWMCLGDFNDISYYHEKEGQRKKSQCLIDAFNSMIGNICMEDLGALSIQWLKIFVWKTWVLRGPIREEEMKEYMRDLTKYSSIQIGQQTTRMPYA